MSATNEPASDPHNPVPLEYGRSSSAPTVPPKFLATSAIIAVLFCCAFAFIVDNRGRYYAERSNRIQCALNMRQIAQAIAMYANTHGGLFPNDVQNMMINAELSSEAFVCPSSTDTPAPPGPTTQATAAGLSQPGHCSYIYLGRGLTDQTVTPDTVLLYEPLADHGGEGMNVMFGDFHVEWIYASAAQAILTRHAAGTQPIRLTIDSSGRHASIQR